MKLVEFSRRLDAAPRMSTGIAEGGLMVRRARYPCGCVASSDLLPIRSDRERDFDAHAWCSDGHAALVMVEHSP